MSLNLIRGPNLFWDLVTPILIVFAFVSNGHADHSELLEKSYPRGDAYFLIGNLEKDIGDNEFANFASIARWLSTAGFRPILSPAATVSDLREAIQNPRTSLIIWSSHGSNTGEIRDVNKVPIPKDIFVTLTGPRLSNVILSACHGDCIVHSFERPPQMQWTYWKGLTDSNDLHSYLVSTEFENNLFRHMENNPISINLTGGALPGRPNKLRPIRCDFVFN